MAYVVRFVEDCYFWFCKLNDDEKAAVTATIKVLKEYGPQLSYPYSSKIYESNFSHMRELRIQHKGKPYRILYIFDPHRSAILLVGGNKTGDERWYKKHIPLADKLYKKYLNSLERKND